MPSFKAGRKNAFSMHGAFPYRGKHHKDKPQPIDKKARARFFANVNAIAGIEPQVTPNTDLP